MFIKKHSVVQLHGGAFVFVVDFFSESQTMRGYNISSTSMRFKDYSVEKIKVKNLHAELGKSIITNGNYDMEAADRVNEIMQILNNIISKPKSKPTAKKHNKPHFRRQRHKLNYNRVK
jgi:hypothetical protein